MFFDKVFDKAGSVATTNNRSGGGFFTNKFGGEGARSGIGRIFGVAEQSVPDDEVGIDN